MVAPGQVRSVRGYLRLLQQVLPAAVVVPHQRLLPGPVVVVVDVVVVVVVSVQGTAAHRVNALIADAVAKQIAWRMRIVAVK